MLSRVLSAFCFACKAFRTSTGLAMAPKRAPGEASGARVTSAAAARTTR